MVGRAYIEYEVGSKAYSISLGTVTSLTPTLNKKSMITPIPSLDMQSAFPIEMGNSKSYSISFKRVNPTHPRNSSDDSDEWSNRKWYEELTECINRWQARTDGSTLRYVANDNVYLPGFAERGYIKSITRTYQNDFNEVITGTLEFVVGRMHVRSNTLREKGGKAIDLQSMYAMISDPDEQNWYTIMYGKDPDSELYNVVDSINITGGPESPFEYATLVISKRKLMEQIPALFDENKGTLIYASKNKLILDVMSATELPRRMLVTKVRVSNSSVTVTAYTEAWVYHNHSLSSDLFGTPSFIIRNILTDPQYGISFNPDNIIMDFEDENDSASMSIAVGTSIWRILQDCAICLGCRIWFADGCAFVVDLRRVAKSPLATYIGEEDGVDLYGSGYCVGTASIDEEGIDPVANSMVVVCTSSEGSAVETVCVDQASVDVYGEVSLGRLNVTELIQSDSTATNAGTDEDQQEGEGSEEVSELQRTTGSTFGNSYLSYLSEPQRSITFTFKELYYINGKRWWQSYFGTIAQVDRIIDSYDKEVITNDSTIRNGKAYHKLAMSSYTRKYPQCTCEYSFGVIANIDLSSSTSQINASLGSR